MLFFYNAFLSYGWAVLAFGLIVKLILLPFQMKSKKSMMRTTMLQPQLKALEKQYGSNKQKYQEAVARLYREAKVNPMSGCLWSLLPFPILILLYQAVRQPLSFLMALGAEEITALTDVMVKLGLYTVPARADAYAQMTLANLLHENFQTVISNSGVAAFADKLVNINFNFLTMNLTSRPQLFFWNATEGAGTAGMVSAVLLFLVPFVSAGLTVLQTKLTQQLNPPADAQAAQTTKSMNLVMPIMSLYICFIMPAAMGVYWIEQSVLGIIQEFILNRHYKKILDAEMAEFNAAQQAKEEEIARKKAETEKLRAEGKTQVNASTSKKRLAAQEKNESEQKAAAYRAAERAAKGMAKELPPSQVGNRVFARGRAYDPDRYAEEIAAAEREAAGLDEDAASDTDITVPADENKE